MGVERFLHKLDIVLVWQPLPCPYCDRIFKQDGRLKEHLKNKHADDELPEVEASPSEAVLPEPGVQDIKNESLQSLNPQRDALGYPIKTPKTLLHEWCQKNKQPLPKFKPVSKLMVYHLKHVRLAPVLSNACAFWLSFFVCTFVTEIGDCRWRQREVGTVVSFCPISRKVRQMWFCGITRLQPGHPWKLSTGPQLWLFIIWWAIEGSLCVSLTSSSEFLGLISVPKQVVGLSRFLSEPYRYFCSLICFTAAGWTVSLVKTTNRIG